MHDHHVPARKVRKALPPLLIEDLREPKRHQADTHDIRQRQAVAHEILAVAQAVLKDADGLRRLLLRLEHLLLAVRRVADQRPDPGRHAGDDVRVGERDPADDLDEVEGGAAQERGRRVFVGHCSCGCHSAQQQAYHRKSRGGNAPCRAIAIHSVSTRPSAPTNVGVLPSGFRPQ